MTRADVKALADALRGTMDDTAIEPEHAALLIAGVCADRIDGFDDRAAQAFFEACGIGHQEACIMASDFD